VIRVGIVGTGWGLAHGRALSTLTELFAVTAVWSREPKRAAAMAVDINVRGRAAITHSWEELVARDDVDLVVIAAPDPMHREIAMFAAAQGKHIVCEKPLAETGEDAQRMLDAANSAGVAHFTGFLWRYSAPCATLRRLIEDGELGDVRQLDMCFRIGPPKVDRAWQAERYGGVFTNSLVHLIDLSRYLTDQARDDAWRVWAHGDAPGSRRHLHSWLHMESQSRPLVVRLQASQDWHMRAADPLMAEVHGTKASAVAFANPLIPKTQRVMLVAKISEIARPVDLSIPGGRASRAHPQRAALEMLVPPARHLYSEHVAPAVATEQRRSDSPTFREGALAQFVVDAALASAETGQWQVVETLASGT